MFKLLILKEFKALLAHKLSFWPLPENSPLKSDALYLFIITSWRAYALKHIAYLPSYYLPNTYVPILNLLELRQVHVANLLHLYTSMRQRTPSSLSNELSEILRTGRLTVIACSQFSLGRKLKKDLSTYFTILKYEVLFKHFSIKSTFSSFIVIHCRSQPRIGRQKA